MPIEKMNDKFKEGGGGSGSYNLESGTHLMAEVVDFHRAMPRPNAVISPPKFFEFDSPFEKHSNVQSHKSPINPGETHSLTSGNRITLVGNCHESCFRISLAQDSELIMEMEAGAKNAGRRKRHADLAVVTIGIDGFERDVPLKSGEQKTKYGVHLGELPRGFHEISIKFAPQKSSINTYGAEIHRAVVVCPPASFKNQTYGDKQLLPPFARYQPALPAARM